ncbi:hypothetical protein ADL06_27100 [Streptomyces sp. NRRL F-6491]|nr:hypothetical protein ADL06_27100 [Streptomyces sp. NRRL F-6491]KOX45468.1 hypothetical protein ADL08_13790 [Streptomyces sp. NRRL F-6492]
MSRCLDELLDVLLARGDRLADGEPVFALVAVGLVLVDPGTQRLGVRVELPGQVRAERFEAASRHTRTVRSRNRGEYLLGRVVVTGRLFVDSRGAGREGS